MRRLREVLTRHVESGDMPGLVALVARRGEVHVEAIGTLEAGGSEPMRRDTIFRIASATKQIAAAAAMTLEMSSPGPPNVFRDFWTCAYQAIDG